MTLMKTDIDGYIRDSKTGAVLSNDKVAYRAYLREKSKGNRVKQLEEDVSVIKSELHEIRSLLLQLANR